MFATMNTVSAPETFWGKLKYNLLPPPVKTDIIHVEDGSDFLHLTVPIIRGKIYWGNVASAAGTAAARLLTPQAFCAPESIQVKSFQAERFFNLVACNSFLKLLQLLPKKELLAECALVDPSGAFLSFARALPRYCRTLKIITAREDKYAPLVRESLEDFGLALQLEHDIGKAFGSKVVFVPSPPAIPTAFSRGSTVFAATPENLYTGTLITPEGVNIPSRYLKLLPKGIAPADFAAALYEISGVTALSACTCPAFRRNHQIISYQELISMLD